MPIEPSPLAMALSGIYPLAGWPMHPLANYIPHQRAGKSVLSLIFPLTARRFIFVGDASAVKRIFNDRHTWVKDTEHYKLMAFFGQNIITTEGDQWLRHRTVTRKAFGEKNNALMWTETISSLQEWFDDWDAQIASGSHTTVNTTDAMRDVALAIIASAGFGMHFGKRSSDDRETKTFNSSKPHPGFKMSFSESLFVAIDTMVVKVLVPRFLYALPISYLRRSDTAYDELRRYIRGIISELRAAGKLVGGGEAEDLSRRLIQANDAELEDDKQRLSDDELISNIYTFFLAGEYHVAPTVPALLISHYRPRDYCPYTHVRIRAIGNPSGSPGESSLGSTDCMARSQRCLMVRLDARGLRFARVHACCVPRDTTSLSRRGSHRPCRDSRYCHSVRSPQLGHRRVGAARTRH